MSDQQLWAYDKLQQMAWKNSHPKKTKNNIPIHLLKEYNHIYVYNSLIKDITP